MCDFDFFVPETSTNEKFEIGCFDIRYSILNSWETAEQLKEREEECLRKELEAIELKKKEEERLKSIAVEKEKKQLQRQAEREKNEANRKKNLLEKLRLEKEKKEDDMNKVLINIKTLMGSDLKIMIDPDSSVFQLKTIVKEKFEFEVEFDIIILLYEKKILGSDERRIDSYLPLSKDNPVTIYMKLDISGGRHWRRRRVYATPKKNDRRAAAHVQKKNEFLQMWKLGNDNQFLSKKPELHQQIRTKDDYYDFYFTSENEVKKTTIPTKIDFYDFMRFIEAGNIRFVRAAIENHNINVNRTDNIGQTPLVEAISNKRFQIAFILIKEYNADVNLPTSLLRESPLSRAVYMNSMRLVKYLIKCGADLSYVTSEGKTPLDIAIIKGYADIAIYILERGGMTQQFSSNFRNEIKNWGMRNILSKWLIEKDKKNQEAKLKQAKELENALGDFIHFNEESEEEDGEGLDDDSDDNEEITEDEEGENYSNAYINNEDYQLFIKKITLPETEFDIQSKPKKKEFFPRIRYMMLYRAPRNEQMRLLSERIYPKVLELCPNQIDFANDITGMILSAFLNNYIGFDGYTLLKLLYEAPFISERVGVAIGCRNKNLADSKWVKDMEKKMKTYAPPEIWSWQTYSPSQKNVTGPIKEYFKYLSPTMI